MRSFAVHPSYRPTVNADQITVGTFVSPWPSAQYLAFPVPYGFDEMALAEPMGGQWFIDSQNGKALKASYSYSKIRRILRKREQWPTSEYAALPVPAGWIKTGELADPRMYKGRGTDYLSYDGGVTTIQSPPSLFRSCDDPRRYILRRARKWELVEIGKTAACTGQFYIGTFDSNPHECTVMTGSAVPILSCTEIK